MYVGGVIVLYRFSISSKANPRLFDITSAATPFAFKLLDLKYMEQGADIRWIQRYANFHKACGRLLEVTEADRFIDDFLSSWMKH